MSQEDLSQEEFSKLIGPYLDGELSAEDCRKVEKSLADSAECRQQASGLETLDRIAREDSPPAVDEKQWQEVLASVTEVSIAGGKIHDGAEDVTPRTPAPPRPL